MWPGDQLGCQHMEDCWTRDMGFSEVLLMHARGMGWRDCAAFSTVVTTPLQQQCSPPAQPTASRDIRTQANSVQAPCTGDIRAAHLPSQPCCLASLRPAVTATTHGVTVSCCLPLLVLHTDHGLPGDQALPGLQGDRISESQELPSMTCSPAVSVLQQMQWRACLADYTVSQQLPGARFTVCCKSRCHVTPLENR